MDFSVTTIIFLKVLNLGFFFHGAINTPSISSYLLYIFIGNLFVYTGYYMIMKMIYKEKMTFQPIIYLILAMSFGFPAMYFFVTTAKVGGSLA